MLRPKEHPDHAASPLPLLPAVTIALGLCAAIPALAADCAPPTKAELEAIATAYFNAFNQGDRAALDALLADDYVQNLGAIMSQDRATHLDRLAAVRSGFPDGVYTIDWTLADGDKIVIRNTFRGTQQGEFAGVPASGNTVAIGAFHVHRVECGKIAETWNAGDALGLFYQMGALDLNVTTAPDEEAPPSNPPKMADCVETTPEQNIAAARRWYDEALNGRHLDMLDEILWPNAVHHAGLSLTRSAREAVKAACPAQCRLPRPPVQRRRCPRRGRSRPRPLDRQGHPHRHAVPRRRDQRQAGRVERDERLPLPVRQDHRRLVEV